MASSPDPFIDPDPPFEVTSSPPLPSTVQSTADIDMEEESSSFLPSISNLPTRATALQQSTFDFSSDPLGEGHFSPAGFSATTHRPSHILNRKRGPPAPGTDHLPIDKEPRLSAPTHSQASSAREAIFQARDLLVQAYTLTQSREEQAKLLDLLEVFREYTEKGRLQTASTIIASQVANLETATRQIEAKAKALAKTTSPSVPSKPSILRQPLPGTGPPGPPGPSGLTGTTGTLSGTPSGTPSSSYASIAGNGQEWTLVKPKTKPLKAGKTTKPNRLILVRSIATPPDFSPLALRNAFNKAFADKGVKGPVINTVTKSLGQNLVISTTSQFSADYLLEKQAIWEHLIAFKSAQKDEPWHKVVLHGVPTADFNNPEGMKLVIDEITTFNKGLTPIGTPYWLSSLEKRTNQRAGSVVVAFATAEEASRAIRYRLYIAGISVRVEKLYSTAFTTQCFKCQGFGHLDNYCKRQPTCRLCGEKHATQQHVCKTCSTKGIRCLHLVPNCANCKQAHTADNKACEVLIAIKATKATTIL
jgi:hypothetical protein